MSPRASILGWLLIAVGFIFTAAAQAQVTFPYGDRLTTNQRLFKNQGLKSVLGQYTFVVQSDNNCVVYRSNGQPSFATGTNAYNISFATIQGDGNFVVYDSDGVARYSKGYRAGTNTQFQLVMQDDGNLITYQTGTLNANINH